MMILQAAFDWSGPNSENDLPTLLPSASNHRSNQLKLQENMPKFLTVEVVSSKVKASVTIDGTTVCFEYSSIIKSMYNSKILFCRKRPNPRWFIFALKWLILRHFWGISFDYF